MKQLRGENREIDDIIGNSDVKELSNLQDADMLSVLREENKQKDKVAAVLRVERDRVMKLQAEREREIHQLNKQVEGASNAEAIQMMQVCFRKRTAYHFVQAVFKFECGILLLLLEHITGCKAEKDSGRHETDDGRAGS